MLKNILDKFIKVGRLTVIWPDGRSCAFGQVMADNSRLDVTVRLSGAWTPWKLALNPDLHLGEAYMNGTLVLEQGTLRDLLEICARNVLHNRHPSLLVRSLGALSRRLQQRNSPAMARRNAAHHYDLPYALYRQFLDEDLQYSCAYFPKPGCSLDEAQRAKKRHIAAKLQLRPGQRVLDIGCGWGGLALTLARTEDVDVLGVTLSPEQLIVAQQRAKSLGLDKRVRFELCDYRELTGKFDRIVSVGMFEHVGAPQYTGFFDALKELLADKGVVLLHSIGRMQGPGVTSAFIRKYIFPGGYVPALSQVMPAIERSGLWLTDLEILRLHYAETLRHWRDRFLGHDDGTADQRFRRMWEFYLTVSEMSFRFGGFMVFQAQLARQVDAVPITRDYMFEQEQIGRRMVAVRERSSPAA
jgi:cyclopropane-fatty-acyl-phospholipid synthase